MGFDAKPFSKLRCQDHGIFLVITLRELMPQTTKTIEYASSILQLRARKTTASAGAVSASRARRTDSTTWSSEHRAMYIYAFILSSAKAAFSSCSSCGNSLKGW